MDVIEAVTPKHLEQIREVWQTYWDDLGFTPCFQDFGAELAGLPGRYARPFGCLLMAVEGGEVAGAVAYRSIDESTCEAKRLYVVPKFRGKGVGRLLMDRLIAEARRAGYHRMVGDTLPVMADAIKLYDRMGFERTESYPGSTASAICIEYKLL